MIDLVVNGMKFHVDAIVLDLDGTIVDSKEAYIEAAKAAFSSFGKKPPSQNIAFEIPKRFELGIPLDDLTQRIDVAEFSKAYLKSYYAAAAVKSKPFPRVTVALEKLSTKSKLGLTTRRCVSKNEVMQQLSKIGLGKFFKVIITGIDTRNPKPSPESIIKCSIQLDVEPRNCLVVGDSVTDIEAGKNAGARTAAVFSGIFSRDELRKTNPDLTLESVTELPDFIE
jgi:phosphoglycolate phosphatase-like HAD superfamily hydrolase